MIFHALVTAKAPVAGLAKTRLGADIGMDAAAALAAAALLDTVGACTEAVGAARCHLALEGDLADATEGARLVEAVSGWTVRPQSDGDLAERLAAAHAEVPGPVVQVGMDTPQVTSHLLHEVAAGLAAYDAVLGPAEDGGWWVLALREPAAAAALVGVPMSTATTYAETLRALEASGLRVGSSVTLRDVDTVEDAAAVAAGAPSSRFAAEWVRRRGGGRGPASG